MRPVATILVVVLLAQTVGCVSWSPQRPGATAPALVADHPGQLRAVLADGRQLDVRRPRVQGDSLLGFSYDSLNYRIPVAVALADVWSVSARRFSPAKTVLLIPVLAYGLMALALAGLHSDAPR